MPVAKHVFRSNGRLIGKLQAVQSAGPADCKISMIVAQVHLGITWKTVISLDCCPCGRKLRTYWNGPVGLRDVATPVRAIS